MISAYKDPARRQVVLVCINMTPNATSLPLTGLKIRGGQFAGYLTTSTKALTKSVVPAGQVELEQKSITILVGTY